ILGSFYLKWVLPVFNLFIYLYLVLYIFICYPIYLKYIYYFLSNIYYFFSISFFYVEKIFSDLIIFYMLIFFTLIFFFFKLDTFKYSLIANKELKFTILLYCFFSYMLFNISNVYLWFLLLESQNLC